MVRFICLHCLVFHPKKSVPFWTQEWLWFTNWKWHFYSTLHLASASIMTTWHDFPLFWISWLPFFCLASCELDWPLSEQSFLAHPQHPDTSTPPITHVRTLLFFVICFCKKELSKQRNQSRIIWYNACNLQYQFSGLPEINKHILR